MVRIDVHPSIIFYALHIMLCFILFYVLYTPLLSTLYSTFYTLHSTLCTPYCRLSSLHLVLYMCVIFLIL